MKVYWVRCLKVYLLYLNRCCLPIVLTEVKILLFLDFFSLELVKKVDYETALFGANFDKSVV